MCSSIHSHKGKSSKIHIIKKKHALKTIYFWKMNDMVSTNFPDFSTLVVVVVGAAVAPKKMEIKAYN